MRKMRKFLNILFLCTLALGLSSCEPDDGEDYYIYDTLPVSYTHLTLPTIRLV